MKRIRSRFGLGALLGVVIGLSLAGIGTLTGPARSGGVVAQNTTDLQPHPKLSEPNMPDEDVYFE